MSAKERLTLVAALAVALGTAALEPLYSDMHWFGRALGAIAVVAGTGLMCRRAHVPAVLQPLLSAAALAAFVCMAFARTTLTLGLVPTGRTVSALHQLIDSAVTDIDRLPPPVPANPGLALVAVLGVGAVALAVDLIAVVLGRAALAGLPLLVLFAVPSAVLSTGLGWFPFTLGAIGWLSLLLVEGGERISRWGSPLRLSRPERGSYDDASLGRVGRRIGAAALGVAVVVPALVPGLNSRLVGGGEGDGPGKGSHTTVTYNPITRMRADLLRPTPHNVLVYTTTAKTPDYLRLTTLDRFEDAGWSSSKLVGSEKSDGVKDTLPPPIGLSSATTEIVRTRIRIQSLNAQWLPVPAVPTRVQVSGPWLYDDVSETVFGIHTGTKKLHKPYTVTAVHAVPERTLLAEGLDSGTPRNLQQYRALPEVTPKVAQITQRVIAGKVGPYAQVEAIQNYFTDPRNGFRYFESSAVPGINSKSALEAFLIGRRGFCEQYASAMAAMIRLAGVPARVAIGFTAGTQQSNGSYQVTTRDAHAWPEAWFAGSGWVRFEPTPRSDGQAVVPPYAVPAAPGEDGSNTDVPAQTQPSAGPSADPQTGASRGRLEQDQTDVNLGGASSPHTGRTVLLAVLGGVLLVLLVFAPRLLHLVRRRARWRRAQDPAAAWAQVYDDAADLGHTWRDADSPRAAAARLAERFGLVGGPAEALARIAAAAERARYAREAGAFPAGLEADCQVVREGLHAAAGRGARRRAWFLPASTLQWAAAGAGTFVADRLDRIDEFWAAVGRRLRPRRAA